MFRLFIKISIMLLFFPMVTHAQKEDFQPPKVNQKTNRAQKVPSKKKSSTDVSPFQKKENKKSAPADVKKNDKKNNKDSNWKPDRKKSSEHQDSVPTPGFIKYIPRTQDTSFDFSKMSDYQVEVLAARNNQLAQVELGGRWLFDETGENLPKGIAWLEKAANSYNSDAQALLGLYYYQCLNDGYKALPLFIGSARQGNVVGQYYLGMSYFYGEFGINQDFEAAVYYFFLAAKQGLPAAQYCVGICLYYGIGTEPNWDWAKQWMEYAASNGEEAAIEFLQSNPFINESQMVKVSY